MSLSPIKVGLVGLSAKGSWASQAHLPYLTPSPLYEVTALQNSSLESGKAAVEKYSLPSSISLHDTVASLIADPTVTLIVISVKVPDHAALAEPSLRAKKDVFVEWPLGRSLAEAESLTALARTAGVRTFVGLQARQAPSIRKAKAMIAAGDLGEILGTSLTAYGGIFGPTITHDMEYLLDIDNGANLLTIPAAHTIDALCYVLGEWEYVSATLANARPELEVLKGGNRYAPEEGKSGLGKMLAKTAHDYISVTGKMKKGGVATVVYQGGTSVAGKNLYWEIVGTKGSLVFEGPSGHVQIASPTLKFAAADSKGKLQTVDVEIPQDPSWAVGRAYDVFAGKGDGPVVSFEDAVVRHRMLDAIYKSAESGKRETYNEVY